MLAAALQVELKTGQTYRGELHDAEDNWNCQLKNVTFTERVCDACAICVIVVSALSTAIALDCKSCRSCEQCDIHG
jgi:small nuclear ribonucleoprotein (snRNP)-like protein